MQEGKKEERRCRSRSDGSSVDAVGERNGSRRETVSAQKVAKAQKARLWERVEVRAGVMGVCVNLIGQTCEPGWSREEVV